MIKKQLRIMSDTEKAVVQIKLERVCHELDEMDLPCIALTFGETPEGSPHMILVSDAPSVEKAIQVLEVLVHQYRKGKAEVTIKDETGTEH